MAERIYQHEDLRVRWLSDLCVKCGACHEGLPQVFNPEQRPWVKLDQASTEEIIEQVNQYPSGALSIV